MNQFVLLYHIEISVPSQ